MRMEPNTSRAAVIDAIAHNALSYDGARVKHLSSQLPVTDYTPRVDANVPVHTVQPHS